MEQHKVRIRSAKSGAVSTWNDDGHARNDRGASSAQRANLENVLKKRDKQGRKLFYLVDTPRAFAYAGVQMSPLEGEVWNETAQGTLAAYRGILEEKLEEARERVANGEISAPLSAKTTAAKLAKGSDESKAAEAVGPKGKARAAAKGSEE